jgi:hypothetical protein
MYRGESTLSPSGVTGAIRQKLARIDKDLPLIGIATMADAVEVSVSQPRFRTLLLGVFAAMAVDPGDDRNFRCDFVFRIVPDK